MKQYAVDFIINEDTLLRKASTVILSEDYLEDDKIVELIKEELSRDHGNLRFIKLTRVIGRTLRDMSLDIELGEYIYDKEN